VEEVPTQVAWEPAAPWELQEAVALEEALIGDSEEDFQLAPWYRKWVFMRRMHQV